MIEAKVQQEIRIEASRQGMRLWRNNVGACSDNKGRLIRYGLANESAGMNRVMKSSDLIGITPIVITQEMVGSTIGVFTSIEVKHPGWKYSGKGREKAQNAWLDIVKSLGGIGKFITKKEDL